MMERLLKRVYEAKRLSLALKIASHAIVFAGILAFVFILWQRATEGFSYVLVTVLCTSVSFIGVSIFRRVKNSPRPYETYDFYISAPKDKRGRSFPSRHVFSAFVIATVAIPDFPIACALLCFLGVCLSACRVLLGLHFIKDVVWGAVIGVSCGAVGVLIMELL